MNVGRGVKQRREQRIRAILERSDAHGRQAVHSGAGTLPQQDSGMRGEADTVHPEQVQGRGPSPSLSERQPPPKEAGIPAQRMSEAEPDPETEWKRKSQEWLASGSSNRSSWFGPDEPVTPPRQARSMLRGLLIKLGISAVLFAVVWGVFRLDEQWVMPLKRYVAAVLTEDMDTRAIAAWYGETFAGAPSFIPIFRQEGGGEAARVNGPAAIVAPVSSGQVIRTFAETLAGVDIASRPSSAVVSIDTGRVTHVTGGGQEGYSIVIQHAGKRTSLYGRLKSVSVQPNDWVEAGDRIGELPASEDGSRRLLYFAVRVDGVYVDPTDVVPLD